jgi:hypothetical protein
VVVINGKGDTPPLLPLRPPPALLSVFIHLSYHANVQSSSRKQVTNTMHSSSTVRFKHTHTQHTSPTTMIIVVILYDSTMKFKR